MKKKIIPDLFKPQRGVSIIMWYNHIKIFFFQPPAREGVTGLAIKVPSKFLIVREHLRSEAEVVFLHCGSTRRPQASGFCCWNCRSLLPPRLCSSLRNKERREAEAFASAEAFSAHCSLENQFENRRCESPWCFMVFPLPGVSGAGGS